MRKNDKLSSRTIRIVYLHKSPELHPRTSKISESLKKYGHELEIFRPKFTFKLQNRIISSALNYFLFFIQSLFIRADIVWVANCPDTVGLAPWISSKKYIYDYRSPWSKEVELEFGKGLLSKIAGIIETKVRQKAKAIVIVSSTMYNDVRYLGKPTFVIPNYPLKGFVPDDTRTELSRKLDGLKRDKRIVLFVGKLSRVEGADMLSNVAERLSLHGNTELWIVGDGILRHDIENLQQKYSEIVRFFGWVNYTEVPYYISKADVCIVPRHKNQFAEYYNEEGVQKIAEYLALGKPIVACNIANSDSYSLVDEDQFALGIVDALEGRTKQGEVRFWEEFSESILIDAINSVLALGTIDTPGKVLSRSAD
jgi:glycosyltransferase involved in cell wall biosynthesis